MTFDTTYLLFGIFMALFAIAMILMVSDSTRHPKQSR
jgi:hypothetical protein